MKTIKRSLDFSFLDQSVPLSQAVKLIQIPGRSDLDIETKITSYDSLIDDFVAEEFPISSNDNRNNNLLFLNDFLTQTLITGKIIALVNNAFLTKAETLDSALNLIDSLSKVSTWRDGKFSEFQKIDTGEVYQQTQEGVNLTSGYLVEISFSLKQERKIIVDRKRTIIDLTAELYGGVDPYLNENY